MATLPGSWVTDETLHDLIEGYLIGLVLDERQDEEPEPWCDTNQHT
jgi:hypothetical protein